MAEREFTVLLKPIPAAKSMVLICWATILTGFLFLPLLPIGNHF